MAPSVVATWSAAYSVSGSATLLPAPGTLSLPVPVANTAGDWMFCVIAWRCPPAYPSPTFTVGDDSTGGHNWWEPLVTPNSSTSSATGFARAAIWMCPAARAASNVYVAPTGYSTGYGAIVLDVAGMAAWLGTSANSGFINGGTSDAVTLGSPGASAFILSVCASDNLTSNSTIGGGGGWSAVTRVTSNNGTDHTADIECSVVTQVASGSTTATWSNATSQNLAVVSGAALAAAPALVPLNPAWPVTIWETAPGGGLQTPPDELTWTPLSAQALELEVTQGRQYEAAQLSAGEGTLKLDNPLGNLIPPGTGALAGIDSGTPVRLRCAWTGGSWQMSFHGNGSVASPEANNGKVLPVTAGLTYSSAFWLACSAAYASGVTLNLTYYNSGGTPLATFTSAPVTGQTATLAPVTGLAPANSVHAGLRVIAAGTPASSVVFSAAAVVTAPLGPLWLAPAPGVSWTAVNSATVTALKAFAPDILGPPWATPWYIPFSGCIERLPQQWDDLLRGYTEASVTDAWFGVNYVPQPILTTEMANDFPYALWPCTDPAGSLVASDLAPGNPNPLVVSQSKYGAGGAVQAFDQNSSALLGAQSTNLVGTGFRITQGGGMWGQTSTPAFGNFNQGYSLTCVDGNFPLPVLGMSLEVWFQNLGPTTSTNAAALAFLTDATGTGVNLYFDVSPAAPGGNGTGHLFLYDGSTNVSIGAVNYQSSSSPLTQVVITFFRSTYVVYINGVSTHSGSFATLLPTLLPCLAVNGLAGMPYQSPFLPTNLQTIGNQQLGPFNGYAGFVAVYPFELPPNRIATHYQAGITGLAGEPSGYRIERLLQAGNATGRRVILQSGTPTNVVSCQDIPGQPASASISNIVGDLLPGTITVAPTGDIFHLARQYAWGQAPAWTLGEQDYGGEYPVEGDITFEYDPSQVRNEIQITQLDNQDVIIPSVTAVETASQQAHGTVSDLATGYLEGDALSPLNYGPGLYDLANWLANAYKDPVLRLSSVTVDAVKAPSRWPFVLGAACADMCTVNRRPPSSGNTVLSVAGRISQTQRHFRFSPDGVAASVTCIIDPAPEANILTTGDPVLGVLDGKTVVLGW